MRLLSVSRNVWLRSANADNTNNAFYVNGNNGNVNNNKVNNNEYEVRPDFKKIMAKGLSAGALVEP